MTKAPRFRCAKCEKMSDYRHHVTRRVEHAAPKDKSKGDMYRSEIRTYRCQHCDANNVVTRRAGDWVLMDASRKEHDG